MQRARSRQGMIGLLAIVTFVILKPSASWITAGPIVSTISRTTSFKHRAFMSAEIRKHDAQTCAQASPTTRATASTTTMQAAASSTPDGVSSLTRGGWLRVGAGLAAIVPALGLRQDPALAASDSGAVTVLGAGGKTGRECVEYLASKGTEVRAVARSVANKDGQPLTFTSEKGVSIEMADVTAPSTLSSVVKGSSAVIFASSASKQGGSAKAVDYEGVVNVAKACIDAKVPRLVVVSSGGVATPDSAIYKFLNLFGEIMSWKIRGEDELRSMYAAQGPGAACHYTIVRPGGLTLDAPRGVTAIELNQGDTKSGRIARSDVARVCVESIYSRDAEDCTLECYYKDTGKPLEAVGISNILKQKTDAAAKPFGTESTGDSWDAIFKGLKRNA